MIQTSVGRGRGTGNGQEKAFFFAARTSACTIVLIAAVSEKWPATPGVDSVAITSGGSMLRSPRKKYPRNASFTPFTVTSLAVRALSSQTSTLTDVRAELAAGRPVVVHGYFTDFGHVLVLAAFDASTNEYIAYDPAGRWSQRFKSGGYSRTNATEGRAVRYRAAAVDEAIGFDGRVWLHRFR